MLSVPLKCKYFDGTIPIKLWTKGDPVPAFSGYVGLDTETELITDSNFTPPLVVMGVYNPEDGICYITDWKDAHALLLEVLKRDCKIFLANAGFDYYELHCRELQEAVFNDKVVDILIRAALKEISTIGFIRTYKLVDACKNYIDYEMDKHEDQGDKAARVTFRQDKPVTDEQYRYLALDCACTYFAGMAMGEQATETTHTRGQIVLYHITSNGMPVDRFMFDYCETMLKEERQKYRQQLINFGFPDPMKKDIETDSERINRVWLPYMRQWVGSFVNESYNTPMKVPTKNTCKRLIVYMAFYMDSGQELSSLARSFVAVLCDGKKTMVKAEKDVWDRLSEQYPFLCACETSWKAVTWPMLLERFMQSIQENKDLDGCMADMEELMGDHPEWFSREEPAKPTVFLQEKLQALEKQYPGLEFDRTPKTQNLKCSKTSQWKLDDVGCKDPFLDSYMAYVHANKYIASFCNREYLKSDCKMHARFGIVNTGRSSCAKPNLQQYPSHDKQYPLKNMFVPPKGAVFMSTDYSFAELVSLAENCIQKYGYSVLGTVINADICPHYFFAGVMLGLISADTSFCKDPKAVEEMKKYLKEHVSKDQRQMAKAVNYKSSLNE